MALNANPKKDSDRQLREAVVQLRVAGVALSGFDPYELRKPVKLARKNSPVTVKLNGGYYVSEKTRKAFDDALNDGFKIQQAVAAPAPVVTPGRGTGSGGAGRRNASPDSPSGGKRRAGAGCARARIDPVPGTAG